MITHVHGDATVPLGSGPKLIIHICNDLGRWGKGFVVAISSRWAQPEANYRAWYAGRSTTRDTPGQVISTSSNFSLGEIQLVQVRSDVYVVNMIAQHGIGPGVSGPPIRYKALESCLEKTACVASSLSASVHMPKIGTGLAQGDWKVIASIIERTLVARGLTVTVYNWV